MNGDRMEEEEWVGREKVVHMWGYLPGALQQRAPLLSPVVVRVPPAEASWNDVCGGGCGFALAISDSGKLITWGSTDDLGQSYVTAGKHGEMPEPFPLPSEVSILNAASGWAHCVAATANGDVYTWGWKECVPSGRVFGDPNLGGGMEKDVLERQSSFLTEQVSPRSHGSRSGGGDSTGGTEESTKRRKVSAAKQAAQSSYSGEETLLALPCLVSLSPGVRIAAVAAGGRHTLVLSDVGQVWGWGYGGEGQLGLGSRIRMVSSPHPVPCIESSYGKDKSAAMSRVIMGSDGQSYRFLGSYVKQIACGGRHSAVITENKMDFFELHDADVDLTMKQRYKKYAGAVLTFGWGLYGQCGQGSTDDELSPVCVSSLLGVGIKGVATGLWHTVCVSVDGDVYSFGGNQFGQLGTGADQAETLPRLLDVPSLENVHANALSCGARHTAMITEDDKVFCWGWNKYGQLGLGDVIDRNIPAEVSIEGCKPRKVACGWWHTLLLSESPT